MNTLDIITSCGQVPKKVASTKGGEYSSGCPVCGGSRRFRIWPYHGENGSWMCRECDKGGDAIELLKFAKGMSYKEACDALGKEAKTLKRGRTPRAPQTQAPDFVPRQIADPVELWQAKGASFTGYAHRELLKAPDQLGWLSERGISVETVKRFNLGWNPKKLWRKRTAWGMPDKTIKTEEGEKDLTLFALHRGLVIPYIVNGQVHRLRIRRPDPDLKDRYHVVPGSGMAPMTIWPGSPPAKGRGAWAVVESELDAILIAQDAGDIIGAAGLGSVSTKPDEVLGRALDSASVALVSLDSDEAGKKRWPWWQKLYPQADRWPVPKGKDPGDFRKDGGDIRAWIVAGLPLGLRPVEKTTENPPEGLKKEEPFESGPAIKDEANQTGAADDLSKTVPAGPAVPLTGFVAYNYNCPKCRKPLEVIIPRGSSYKDPCFKCLPPYRPFMEKRVK